MTGLLLPVKPTSIASFESHTRRRPKSTEPGTDLFVPIGTRVVAPYDGKVYAVGNTIGPMTGRWIGIDMTNGMRFRCMHHSEILLKPGKLVERGEGIAISGASGYGYEDWSKRSDMPGAHTHATLWPTHQSIYGYRPNGTPYSIDLMKYIGGPAGGGSTTPPTQEDIVTMHIAKNRDDSAKEGSHFLWGDGKEPEIIGQSTVDIFSDAGVKISPMSRDRWLWLLNWARKRARTTP